MAYLTSGDGNGALYIGNVKWSNDYKDVMLFSSEARRNSFLESTLTRIKTNVIFFPKDGYIDVNKRIKDIYKMNYLMFTNDSELDGNNRYLCFITNYDYIAPQTTRIYVELDVFQTYYYNTKFFTSYIERATVKKSYDTIGRFMQPEPIGADFDLISYIGIVSGLGASAWEPRFCLTAISKINATNIEYGGDNTTLSIGTYSYMCDTIERLRFAIEQYHPIEGRAADHSQDITGIHILPKWAYDLWDADTPGTESNFSRPYYNSTKTYEKDSIVTYGNGTLANGRYTPRNKKMLTSICRMFTIYNENGFNVGFKPEYLSGNKNQLNLAFYFKPCDSTGIHWQCMNYSDAVNGFGNIPYHHTIAIGFDQNTGLQKSLNVLNTIQNVGGAAISAGASLAAGNPVGAVTGALGTATAALNGAQQLAAKGASVGVNSGLLGATRDFNALQVIETTPSLDDLSAIDNFFDVYGYAINKHANPVYTGNYIYITSRTNWNYIKTKNINCNTGAPTDYEQKFKSIFDSGVTFWHNYNTFGDYSQPNN